MEMMNKYDQFRELEQLAFRYSELAYIEATKPKYVSNPWVRDHLLQSAKNLTNCLIENGIWQPLTNPVNPATY